MFPILMSHGGFCCGAKQLYGFYCSPSDRTDAVTKERYEEQAGAGSGNIYRRWLWVEGQVRETYEARLKRQLRHVRDTVLQNCYVRAGNKGIGQMVEATLTDSQRDSYGWGKVFEDLGFKEVSHWTNCNSKNGLTTYHLYIDADYTAADVEEPAEKKKATPKKDPFAI